MSLDKAGMSLILIRWWRFANYLIIHYRKDAAIYAAMRADKILKKGDVESAAGRTRPFL